MWRRVLVRVLIAVAVALLVCYGALRSYVVYEAHRGAQLLEALKQVRIGDSKDSVLALAKRFPGSTEMDPPGPNAYEFGVSPWLDIHSLGHPANNVLLALVRLKSLRAIGLRDSTVEGGITIEHGRVTCVVVHVGVEGRDGFLRAGWVLQSRAPGELPSSFHTQHLLGIDQGWQLITADITPEASGADKAAARNINLKCLTSFSGCATLADLAPDAARRVGR